MSQSDKRQLSCKVNK